MKKFIKTYLPAYFTEGHSRTVKAKQNIVGLFGLRGASLAISFVLVPLTLGYLNQTRYGIWLTLSSLISWVNVLDVGLGNGLRNKFAEALAKDDLATARMYVSTTYFIVALIALAAIVLFFFINPFLHWSAILNASPTMEHELTLLATIVFVCFCLRLVFGLIGTLLMADQKPAIASLLEVLTNFASLIAIIILTKVSVGSLLWLGLILSFFTAFIPMAANVWFFGRDYRQYIPKPRWVNTEYSKQLGGLGVQFFILQLAGIAIFSSSNIIITQFFGPADVTPYNIAFKYFGISLSLFTLILTPFWSAYTDAFTRGDTSWIERSNKTLIRFWLYFSAAVLVMLAASNVVYAFWVGREVRVPFGISVWMAVYVLIVAWSNIFAYFINGTGKIRLQLWAATAMSVVSVSLAIVFSKYLGMGPAGVVAANCIALFPGCILWPIQMRKILRGDSRGIWGM